VVRTADRVKGSLSRGKALFEDFKLSISI